MSTLLTDMARPREFDIDRALEQAMRVFWEQGYQGTSVGDVMEAAAVQKQSLYCAFGDKHSLFVKSLELYRTQVLAQIKGIVDRTDSPLDAVARVMRFAIEQAAAGKCPKGCLGANTALELGMRDPEAITEVRNMFRGMEKVLGETIKKGQEKGEITTRFQSGLIAQHLLNTLNGIRILERTGASAARLNAIVDMALATIEA
jgi:TetR/AcrR family transcriptional repressor of nem operon